MRRRGALASPSGGSGRKADRGFSLQKNPRSPFLSRLRTAWLVLTGKITPSQNRTVFFQSQAFSVTTLHSSIWVGGEKLDFAEDMLRRELFDLVSPYVRFHREPTGNGGCTVTGELFIYSKEREAETC